MIAAAIQQWPDVDTTRLSAITMPGASLSGVKTPQFRRTHQAPSTRVGLCPDGAGEIGPWRATTVAKGHSNAAPSWQQAWMGPITMIPSPRTEGHLRHREQTTRPHGHNDGRGLMEPSCSRRQGVTQSLHPPPNSGSCRPFPLGGHAKIRHTTGLSAAHDRQLTRAVLSCRT